MKRSPEARFLCGLGFTLLLPCSGCATWKPIEPAITETIHEDPPGAVLLHLRDGTRWRVRDPEIRADSLFGLGFPYDFGRAAKSGKPVGFALTDIEEVKVERGNLLVPMLVAVGMACVFYVSILIRWADEPII